MAVELNKLPEDAQASYYAYEKFFGTDEWKRIIEGLKAEGRTVRESAIQAESWDQLQFRKGYLAAILNMLSYEKQVMDTFAAASNAAAEAVQAQQEEDSNELETQQPKVSGVEIID